MAFGPKHLPEDPKLLQQMVLDLVAQLDREFSERSKFEALLRGASEGFTGTVRIDPLFQAPDPALVQGASVTFEPGVRTAWHRHPLGQTLIVTSGCGWVQREGGPIEEIRPGDVVWVAWRKALACRLRQ